MFKRILLILALFGLVTTYSSPAYAANSDPDYTTMKDVYMDTFNEYRYKITDEFFELRNYYDLNGSVDTRTAAEILVLAKKGYNYLPDSLSNKNYYNHLKTSIERGIKYPNNTSNYESIVTALDNYLEKTNIDSITGRVEAYPSTGNAPLTVTLRGNVSDPTGTKIPAYNYTWWMHENGKKIILGDNISLTHVFKEEGNFSIFLDVSSSHKNEQGYIDVLPFSSRADITIKEKVASLIIKINSTNLRNKDEIKFTPEEARYGLLFDATSSTPTSGSKFIKTSWDFGNGEEREYSGDPRVERVTYAKEGEFTVTLKLQTNELKQIERKFKIMIHDPIATISSSQEEGFMGDKFTFSAKNSGNDKDLSYSWEIIDLNLDKVIFRKVGTLFTYSFNEKGKYNVKMQVTEPSGETDVDSKIIYINSRPPVADFTSSIPFKHKPNKIFLDATKSYDPDYTDDGNLKYSWIINGDRVELDEPNFNGSTGYYTFDSVGEHSVVLDVEDPDGISSQKKEKVSVKSILSVDFFAFPRVAQRLTTIRLVSESPEAKFYEWDFGDGSVKGGNDENITHRYYESGIFNVKLKVRDEDDNINSYTKNVYIGDSDSPYAFVNILDDQNNDVIYDETACSGSGAYVIDRVSTVRFSGKESINIDGKNTGLTYSWKLAKEGYRNSQEFTKKFDELGCFPIKLTVKSDDNGRTDSKLANVDVRNLKPVLSSIDIRVQDSTTDPVIVNVSALGAKDTDGVIQSYLWYYYTDVDSEPQDFRATKFPNTSFVLPKVTGNYYFVVVMKDNNESIITSEEITGAKYFITLTGDNLNTPIVQLNVDDSSIAIGDEATFTSNVENILGQDLTKKVKYSWDFDGDGFYDKEGTSNTATYKYLSSGEKHVKVKAKYKGFSNTKSVTLNISNILKPDFGYISIGNEFIFFDESLGTAESYEWDLGDGTIIKSKKTFSHKYEDSKVSHQVKLKISEGTKVKEIEQKVVKNVKNIITSRKGGLVVFSNQKISSENEIVLEDKSDNLFVYLGESKPDVAKYIIDYNIEYDSDLNGGNDDDEDNSGDDSYSNGSPIKVKLDDSKYQTFRVYIMDELGEVIDSGDYSVTKNYIEENLIDLETIVFEGVSDSTKLKIEKLKDIVNTLPKQHKLKALMYVQKLKEEWSDNREKTNIILEFEGFIYDTEVDNANEIIDLLESLLVENQDDKSEKAITFNALKNLLPTSIICTDVTTGEQATCYEDLVSKLEAIRDNGDVEQNKALGSEILSAVQADEVMTNKQKIDFKAILKTLVYGGVENIPDVEQQEVIDDDETEASGNLLGLLKTVGFWIIVIILVFCGFAGLFYIYYLISNKDKNVGFQDFIIDRTQGGAKYNKGDELDVLGDLSSEIKVEKNEDILSKPLDSIDSKAQEKKEESKLIDQKQNKETQEKKVEDKKSTNKEEVPDWLKGSFDENDNGAVEKKEEIKQTEIKQDKKVEDKRTTKQEDVPDWLKGSFDESDNTFADKKQELKQTEPKQYKKEENKKVEDKNSDKAKQVKSEEKVDLISDKEIEEATKVEKDDIPDWLKGSFDEEPKKEDKKDEKQEKQKNNEEKKGDDNIPDWLKGSFDEESKQEEVKVDKKDDAKKEEKQEIKEQKLKEKEQTSKKEKTEEEKNSTEESSKDEDTKKDEIIQEKKEVKQEPKKDVSTEEEKSSKPRIKNKTRKNKKAPDQNKQETKQKTKKDVKEPKQEIQEKKESKKQESKQDKTDTKTTDTSKNTELWDDGMKVPDWLKTDDEK